MLLVLRYPVGQYWFYHLHCFPIVVSSGSVSVNADSSVQLLAEEACAIEDIDVQVCYPLCVCTCVVYAAI